MGVYRAKQMIDWEPQYKTNEGLDIAIEYFKQELGLSKNKTTVWIS